MTIYVIHAQAGLMLQNRLPEIAVLPAQVVYIVVQVVVAVAAAEVPRIVIPVILIIIQVKCVARIIHRIIIQAHMELPVPAAMLHAHM